MSQHTPGPWTIEHTDEIYGADSAPVAYVQDTDRTNQQNRANARLIAAAPELLAALKRIVEWDDADCDASLASINAARAVITKAEGVS